jgi:hypothetical protein
MKSGNRNVARQIFHCSLLTAHYSLLGRYEAADLETEEGVGIGVHADLGVWSTGFFASEALVVHADVHGLDGADFRIEDVGYRHGIEQSWSLLAHS